MLRYFIVFIFYAGSLWPQDPDTLLNSILRMENDTEKVNQLYTRGYDLVDKNPGLAILYARNCENIAAKIKSPRHVSKSYNLSGILLYKQGYYKKAIIYFEKYLSSSRELGNTLAIAFGLTNLGKSYLELKQYEKAENYFLSALEYYNNLNNRIEIANGLINLGALKHLQKQSEVAYQNYKKALEIGNELNNYEIKAICLNNMAQIFSDQGNYEKALAYNFDALELRELMGLDIDRSDSYLSIAEIALKQKKLKLAEENLNLALELCNKLSYQEGKMNWHKLAAEFYSQKNNYQLAYGNLKRFTELSDSLLPLHNEEPVYDFNEKETSAYWHSQNILKNTWLLIILSFILIVIPFVLIRYMR